MNAGHYCYVILRAMHSLRILSPAIRVSGPKAGGSILDQCPGCMKFCVLSPSHSSKGGAVCQAGDGQPARREVKQVRVYILTLPLPYTKNREINCAPAIKIDQFL